MDSGIAKIREMIQEFMSNLMGYPGTEAVAGTFLSLHARRPVARNFSCSSPDLLRLAQPIPAKSCNNSNVGWSEEEGNTQLATASVGR